MFIKCDCKTVQEARENILLHTKLENRTPSTRHLSLEVSTNVTNLKAQDFKSFQETLPVLLTVAEVCMQICPPLIHVLHVMRKYTVICIRKIR